MRRFHLEATIVHSGGTVSLPQPMRSKSNDQIHAIDIPTTWPSPLRVREVRIKVVSQCG